MKRPSSVKGIVKVTAIAYLFAIAGAVGIMNSCNKKGDVTSATARIATVAAPAVDGSPEQQGAPVTLNGEKYQTLTSILTVADIRENEGSTEVIFNENAEFFKVIDAPTLAALKGALKSGTAVEVKFDPWKEMVVAVSAVTKQGNIAETAREGTGVTAKKVDLSRMKAGELDDPAQLGVMNTTTGTGLNNVIPDFATAQLMFEYISRQCCRVPGPYGIDYCIPFQYCIDGCYARAHKMCYIINKKYRYGTQKIFSFANAGTDKLCVQGQKWGGCCIRWWYHVAPLVTVQTPQGPKAYVFDPAMFDQPVLLSAWLHAQENPVCAPSGYTAHVTMINVRPTSSYTPSGTTGYLFTTDPSYSSTNTTLFNYRYLNTCP